MSRRGGDDNRAHRLDYTCSRLVAPQGGVVGLEANDFDDLGVEDQAHETRAAAWRCGQQCRTGIDLLRSSAFFVTSGVWSDSASARAA